MDRGSRLFTQVSPKPQKLREPIVEAKCTLSKHVDSSKYWLILVPYMAIMFLSLSPLLCLSHEPLLVGWLMTSTNSFLRTNIHTYRVPTYLNSQFLHV